MTDEDNEGNLRVDEIPDDEDFQPCKAIDDDLNNPQEENQVDDSRFNVSYGVSPYKETYQFKIILVGDAAVGKSSILSRYAENVFPDKIQPSIGVEFKVKDIPVSSTAQASYKIWDTVGDEKFRAITKQYYRDANGIFLVFDLTSRDTFEKLDDWFADIKDNAPQDAIVFLVGNKSDLKEDRKVKKEDCDIAARRYNSKYYEVSAKNGSNILMTFEDMAPRLVEVQLEKQKQSGKESKQKTNLLKLGGKKDKGLFNKNNSSKKCC